MTSLTNPKAKKRLTKQAVEDADIDREVIIALMRTGRGRRHVYRRLFFAGIWNEDGNLDAAQLAWKAGVRNEGLRLLALIHEHCPEHYVTMWQESNRLKAAEKAAQEEDSAEEAEEVNDG